MKIGIKNNNTFIHTVCRVNGQKIYIQPKSYIIIDTDNDQEISYWKNLKPDVAKSVGIEVVIDNIKKLTANSNDNIHTESTNDSENIDVSIVDNFVSPVAKQIAESIMPKQDDKDVSEAKEDSGFYTEEQLLQMPKEDLFNICDNFNIKYRKNNSVKTLVNLILESGVM
jgi:hypothetical protein